MVKRNITRRFIIKSQYYNLLLFQQFSRKGEITSAKERCLTILLDTVWLYRSPIPMRRRGIFYLFKWFLLAFMALKIGGEGPAPCG
jgi:hypothetical protein